MFCEVDYIPRGVCSKSGFSNREANAVNVSIVEFISFTMSSVVSAPDRGAGFKFFGVIELFELFLWFRKSLI